ncbi:MAG TPA: YceI family protein [Vicinamibacteria bacterium]
MLSWLLLALGAGALADPVSYKVAADQSRMTVHVGTAGLFKMFGHDHNIEVKGIAGSVDWDPEAPSSSRVVLEIEAASLTVADEELSEEDRAQVQSDMESKALALPENSKIVFQSTEVQVEKSEGASHRLKLRGTLSLRGVTKPVEVPVTVEASEGRLSAKGEMELDSKFWGVPQISAAGGSVKTKEELKLAYEIVALR